MLVVANVVVLAPMFVVVSDTIVVDTSVVDIGTKVEDV